jgi:hypothetical protein
MRLESRMKRFNPVPFVIDFHRYTASQQALHTHYVSRAANGEGPYLHRKLVLLVDRIAKRYTTKIRDCCIKRFQPYMQVHAAMALIDLRFDRTADAAAMAGLDLVCKRYASHVPCLATSTNECLIYVALRIKFFLKD